MVAQFVGKCPISHIGDDTAFKITPSINRFVCFCPACKKREKQGGDVIELVARIKQIDTRGAAAYISGAGKGDDNARPQQEVADGRKPSTFDPLTYLATLDAEHEALKDTGLTPETLLAFQAGYANKGLLRGRLAVAWHNVAGELVAELGAAFLCAHLGIEGDLRHAGYIKTWIELLKSDNKAIFTAAAKAQQAVDYLTPA